MITKIIYVLISNLNDFYLEQMLLSIYSVKKHNPTFTVDVITSTETAPYIKKCKSPVIAEINNITEISIPPFFSDVQKSRFIKTQLTKYVEDDFLYLDVDTIIIKNLNDINKINSPIAAVADGNQYDTLEKKLTFQIELVNRCGWTKELLHKPWFNGGVLLVQNGDDAQTLFDCWHSNWLSSVKHGVNQDQPALCRANQQMRQIIKHISSEWNCQLLSNGFFDVGKAKILHYFANRDQNEFIPNIFFQILRCHPEFIEPIYNHLASCQNFNINKDDYIFFKELKPFRDFVQGHSKLSKLLKLLHL